MSVLLNSFSLRVGCRSFDMFFFKFLLLLLIGYSLLPDPQILDIELQTRLCGLMDGTLPSGSQQNSLGDRILETSGLRMILCLSSYLSLVPRRKTFKTYFLVC